MPPVSKERIEWIDIARGLGLLLVFVGHIHPPYITTWIYTFHMPLFFFLSGMVFSMHPWKDFIRKKIWRLVIPYFCLGAVIYLFYAAVYIYEQRDGDEYGRMLINFLEQKAFWTIWFLAALFFAEIILWLQFRLFPQWLIKITSPLIMLCAFAWYRSGGSTLPWCFDVACVAQFFIYTGYLFKRNYHKLRLKKYQKLSAIILLLIINIVAGMACIKFSRSQLDMSVGLYGNELLTLISAFAGIGAVILFCQMITSKFLTYLGKNTMVFFGWHSRIVIVACGMIYGALGFFQDKSISSQILYCITTLIMIFVILYPTTEILRKHKKIGKYFGV